MMLSCECVIFNLFVMLVDLMGKNYKTGLILMLLKSTCSQHLDILRNQIFMSFKWLVMTDLSLRLDFKTYFDAY